MTLGHRIAVISDGRLQQLGPPQEVYDSPSNVFVAGFIGSPPMNLLRGPRARRPGDRRRFRASTRRCPTRDLVVGIRPESLRRAGGDVPGLDFRGRGGRADGRRGGRARLGRPPSWPTRRTATTARPAGRQRQRRSRGGGRPAGAARPPRRRAASSGSASTPPTSTSSTPPAARRSADDDPAADVALRRPGRP